MTSFQFSDSTENVPRAHWIAALTSLFVFPTTSADPETAKILWLIRLRWVAVAFAFALFGPALHSGFLTRQSVPSFLGVIGLIFLFNVYFSVARSPRDLVSPLETCFHMAFDLAMLTSLLLLTGGFANPFVGVFFLNTSLGGLLIQGRHGWSFLYLSHLLLAATQISLWISLGANSSAQSVVLSFAVYHLLLIAFWLVMRSLGSELSRQATKQTHTRLEFERQSRLRAVGSLAAGFSHEFASPLNAAKIRLERLARRFESDDLIEARASLDVCETIIHRMNSAQLDLSMSDDRTVRLDELFRDIIESWKEENPRAQLHIEGPSGLSARIPPIHFAQVVLNLLDNAYEASPEEKLEARLQLDDGLLRLIVEDQGPGLSPDVIGRIGEPFVTTKPHGTGLGLYVCTLFAQSRGGEIRFEKLQPRGGRFLIEWPSEMERLG